MKNQDEDTNVDFHRHMFFLKLDDEEPILIHMTPENSDKIFKAKKVRCDVAKMYYDWKNKLSTGYLLISKTKIELEKHD